MKGKKMSLLTLLLSFLLGCAVLVACEKDDKTYPGTVPPDQSELGTISLVSTATVEEFETITLTPTIEGTAGTIEWSSASPEIAAVDQTGIVSGVKAGVARISAKMGTSVATCDVTVTETRYAHEIVLSADTLMIGMGESQNVDVSVKFKGKTLDQAEYGITYTWTPLDGADEYVTVTAENDGARATFKGLAVTDSAVKYEVSSTVRGYDISDEVTILVRNAVAFGFENEAFVETGKDTFSLGLTLGDEATDKVTIGNINVSINQKPVSDLTVTWTSSDEGVVSVADGVISAHKEGTAALTGTISYAGEDHSFTVNAAVEKGARTLEETALLESGRSLEYTLPAGLIGTVEKITVNEDTVLYDSAASGATATDGAVTLFAESFPVTEEEMGEGCPMTIETDKIVYTLSADLYTLKIKTQEDFNSWQEIAATVAVQTGRITEDKKGAVMSGYFVLDTDIALTEAYVPKYTSDNLYLAVGNDWNLGEKYGFEGTFDGKGHIIDGLDCTAPKANWSCAFVTSMTKDGVIKNLSFTNAAVAGDASLIVAAGAGTCENIYIEYVKFGNGVNAPSAGRGASTFFSAKVNNINQTLRRVVIDISLCEFDAVPKNLSVVGPRCATMDGVYVIGTTFEESAENSAFISYCHDPVFEAGKIRGEYPTMAAMIADEATGENSKVFGEMRKDSFWEMTEKLAMSAAVYDKACDEFGETTHKFTNKETTISLGQSLVLTVDERYIEFTVKGETDGASVYGNILSVTDPLQVDDTITVVATSLLDNTSAELTLTVTKLKETITAENTVDVDLDLSLSGEALVTGSEIALDLSEVADTVDGKQIAVRLGEDVLYTGTGSSSVVCDFSAVGGGVFGKQTITVSISEEEKDTEILLPVLLISKVITTAKEFDGWQELASYVAVAAGHCTGDKLGLFMDGYFVLGEDISYNKAWTPYKNYSFYWANAENNAWTNGTKCGFQGVFDGRGHIIDGMSVSGQYNAFLVTMSSNAELKNIIFTNASLSDNSSFLARAEGGIYTNIYIQYSSISNSTGEYLSTFAYTGANANQKYNTVVIDVTGCTFDEEVQNVAFVAQWQAYGVHVVGKVFSEIPAFSQGDLAGAQFADFNALLADSVANVASWDTSFWDTATGKPLALTAAD